MGKIRRVEMRWHSEAQFRCQRGPPRLHMASAGTTGHIATNCHRCPSERTIIGGRVKSGASLDGFAVSPDIMIEPARLHRAPFIRCERAKGRTGMAQHAVGMPICPNRPRRSVMSAFQAGNDTNSCVGPTVPRRRLHRQAGQICPWAQDTLVEIPVLRR